MKKIALMLFLSLMASLSLSAQSAVRGIITDEGNQPLFAASVLVQGTKNLVVTASDGSYTIVAGKGDVLEFSMLGKKTVLIPYEGQKTINVILKDDMTLLEDVVVVGYGTQKKHSITGAVSKIDGEQLIKSPAQNITNMMGGLIPGVISYQSSGVPGADGSTLLVRGSGVKAIVDGVPRGIDNLDPTEIESISVLKDASAAAIYGLNSEAVIIVTTKKGQNKPSRISYHGTFNISQNAMELELLDAPGYAYYYNLAREMDGDEVLFTRQMVEKMTNGDDSDGWGNTNWYKEVFGIGLNQNHSVSASGGNDKINYFSTFGYYNQKGNVTGYTHNRINIRTNVEAKIAEHLTLNVGLLGRFTKTERPGITANPNDWMHIGLQLMRIHPYVPKTYNGLSTATRNASSISNVSGMLEESGYGRSWGNAFQGTASLQYDVPFIKGLALKALVAYDVNASITKNVTKPFDVMLAILPTDMKGDISYVKNNGYPGLNDMQVVQSSGRSTNFLTDLSIGYNQKFGKHDLGLLALMEIHDDNYMNFGAVGYDFDIPDLDDLNFAKDKKKNSVSGSHSLSRSVGYVARLNYSYDNKYLLEATCRYDGSYVFYGSASRWGIFPAISLGWRLDKEKWFHAESVDLLKLRVGSGLTGSLGGVSPYTYMNSMNLYQNSNVIGGNTVSSIYTSTIGNTDLTWQKSWQNNIGVDLSMWNGKFRFEADIFYKYIYDMISAVSAQYPSSWGGRFPALENKNKQDHRGFEFLIEHRNRVNDFSYGISLVGSYAFRRWLRYTDAENTPDYLKVTGTEVGSVVGFIAEGLFQNEQDILESPTIPGKAVRPGDIKYKDRNGDGKITYDQDRGYVKGSVFPRFEGGLNFDAAWKGIDFNMKWTYALGRTVALTGVYSGASAGIMDNTAYTKPFYHNGNSPRYLVEDSWREDNKDARFPRLAINSASSNNAFASTWWYENGNYLRLKNLQIGYSFPAKWMKTIGIKGCRLFFEGTNLLTFSKLSKYNIDPEMPSVNNGYYPQQRLLGGGLDIQF